jgi:8-oxo-dGTP pyrophosphatase MutT (NUDIX family)
MTAVRDAATLVLWRDGAAGPEVLMGRRPEGSAFMAAKWVFPGGAVDPADLAAPAAAAPATAARLARESTCPPGALIAAALRELHEETGLILTDGAALRLIFRAITPPGRPRRFDARVFLAPASACSGPADLGGDGELQDLRWLTLDRARAADIPFVTALILAEVQALLSGGDQDGGVPFLRNEAPVSLIERL